MAIQTQPRQDSAEIQGNVGLEALGLDPRGEVHWNLTGPVLIQTAVRRGEGDLAEMGPFVAITAPHTGRSPNDKFVVREPGTEKDVDWGKVNQPFPEQTFDALLGDVQAYLDRREELFV